MLAGGLSGYFASLPKNEMTGIRDVLPPGMATLNEELTAKPAREYAGQDARLYGRLDARRYAKQIPQFTAR